MVGHGVLTQPTKTGLPEMALHRERERKRGDRELAVDAEEMREEGEHSWLQAVSWATCVENKSAAECSSELTAQQSMLRRLG